MACDQGPVEWCAAVAVSAPFDNFIMLIVVLNTLALAADHHNMTETFSYRLTLVEDIFLVIYCAEVIIKNIGLT